MREKTKVMGIAAVPVKKGKTRGHLPEKNKLLYEERPFSPNKEKEKRETLSHEERKVQANIID
jgi:hypothetical protein